MADEVDLFPPKAAAAIRSLLPGKSWREVTFEGSPPSITVADWMHVRAAIGTPAALEEALMPLALPADAPLATGVGHRAHNDNHPVRACRRFLRHGGSG